MQYTQEEIIELAKNVELEDPIDWGDLPVNRDQIYQIIGSQAYEMYVQTNDSDKEAILLATVIKLLIENFTLNLQLNNH